MTSIRLHLRSANLWAALFFLAVGLTSVIVGARYPSFVRDELGPGFLPTVIGWVVTASGAVTLIGGSANAEQVTAIRWRSCLGVLGSLLLYAVLLERAGLAVTSASLVVAALTVTGEAPLRTALLLAVILAGAMVLLFSTALGLPVKVWP